MKNELVFHMVTKVVQKWPFTNCQIYEGAKVESLPFPLRDASVLDSGWSRPK